MKDWFLKYWAEVACGALVIAFGTFMKKMRAQRDSTMAILRYLILQAYSECDRQGYCQVIVLDAVAGMLKQYEILKGSKDTNGVSSCFKKMEEMPSEPPVKKSRSKTRIKGEEPIS